MATALPYTIGDPYIWADLQALAAGGGGGISSISGTLPITATTVSGATTVAINAATATTSGAVPTPPNDNTKVLLGDATWGAPPATGGPWTYTATDRMIAQNAGSSQTGSDVFMAGLNAGASSAASDVVFIGTNAGAGGVTSTNTRYSVVIGSTSASVWTQGTSTGSVPNGPTVLVGGNSMPQAKGILTNSVIVGANIAPLYTGTNTLSEAGDNILIGNQQLTNLTYTGGFTQFAYNVFIGCEVCQTNTSGNAWIANTIIGAQAGNTLSNNGSASCTGNTFLGYQAGHTAGGTGGCSYNTALGWTAGSSLTTGSYCVMIGPNAGTGLGSTNSLFAVEDGFTPNYFLYGNMARGSLMLGNSNANRADLNSGTNMLKIVNGTKGPTPTGGGYFYVSAGALHWVGSSGTDSVVAVA